ncbi:KUP/HAK/KT family potassium transporter [Candidatus Roizmanbacteria bacterium]|nr:KUP/HAK/KT family potassium transporter [Candidatus Roizmanbacteria bacterium]
MSTHSEDSKSGNKGKFFILALAALGVVYGDIGTSPLYAVNEIFFGHARASVNRADVLGTISLIIWAITIAISFKYVVFVLRADSDGEGGVFALYSLLDKLKMKAKPIMTTLLIIAAGLLFGDGIITPAISVVSAIEGLKVVTPTFTPYVVPITIAILTGLFFIQSKGTAKVGKIFGPIVVVWFVTIALLGLNQIIQYPDILNALNPIHAITFLATIKLKTLFFVLGAVILAITGGEAMYADMGHFGSKPIRFTWFSVVYPALLLNYLGQGAFLLSGKEILSENIFFSTVPQPLLIPMVVLAALATIIASQALISGAFSLATQAISLGLLPYIPIVHTNQEHEGQIYVPAINWSLYVGCVILVIMFESSTRLAGAYGLAVAGVMFITSISMIYVAKNYWKWSTWSAFAVFLPLCVIDFMFLAANSLKIFEGGYIPLLICIAILIVMKTWNWGRASIKKTFAEYPKMQMKDLIEIMKNSTMLIPRTIIIMTPDYISSTEDNIPTLKQMFIERYGMLARNLIFLNVALERAPHIQGDRYTITKFYEDQSKGSIISVRAHFGFMEDPNVEKILHRIAYRHELDIDAHREKWLIHVMHERIFPGNLKNIKDKIQFELFKAIHRNADSADHYFGLGTKEPLSIEVLPVYLS